MTIITCSKTAVSNTTWIKTAPNHLWLIHSTKQLSQGHVMMFPWLLANSTNLIILSETLEINVRPTSKIYCQQWRDSTKTLGKIHKYKLLRKIMDYWRFTICENKTRVRLTVVMTTLHPLQSQTRHNAGAAAPAWELRIHMATGGLQHRSCCSTPGNSASTWPQGACSRTPTAVPQEAAAGQRDQESARWRHLAKRLGGVLIYQDCNSTRNITTSFCYIHVFTLKSLSSKDTSYLWRGTG